VIYLHNGTARACCESDATAAKREACGWVRCSYAEWRFLWMIADATDRIRIAREDAQQAQTAPIKGETYSGMLKKVYP
jgi:hypothetical protein